MFGKDFGDHDAVREASQGSGSMMVLGWTDRVLAIWEPRPGGEAVRLLDSDGWVHHHRLTLRTKSQRIRARTFTVDLDGRKSGTSWLGKAGLRYRP
ncbi:hypothetical protein SLA2020_444030 [Shorea laevis]